MKRGVRIIVYASLCLIWSSTWIMIKVGLRGAPPLKGAGIRFILASIVILAILRLKRIELPRTRSFLWLSIFLGFFQMGIPYALVYWGEQHLTSGLTAVLFSTMPLAVAVLARILLGDPLSPAKMTGIVVGVGGVLLIFSESLSFEGTHVFFGMSAIILSAVLASLSSVVIKKYSFEFNPFASIFLPISIGGVILTVSGFILENNRPVSMDPMTLISITYLSLVGTVGAFSLYFWIIKHIDVTILSYQTFIIPILAVLIGWIFLHEALNSKLILGGGLIITGIVLATSGRGGNRKNERLDKNR